jgi:hypothetical protein
LWRVSHRFRVTTFTGTDPVGTVKVYPVSVQKPSQALSGRRPPSSRCWHQLAGPTDDGSRQMARPIAPRSRPSPESHPIRIPFRARLRPCWPPITVESGAASWAWAEPAGALRSVGLVDGVLTVDLADLSAIIPGARVLVGAPRSLRSSKQRVSYSPRFKRSFFSSKGAANHSSPSSRWNARSHDALNQTARSQMASVRVGGNGVFGIRR